MRKDHLKQEPEMHESYGVISFSRFSCTPAVSLFGSSIRHGHPICLTISEGKKYRDFQKNRYMAGKTLCEVWLSPTQFAEAITSFNMGGGVPCTVRHVEGDTFDEDNRQYRKPCPEVSFRRQANQELKEEMSELSEKVETLAKDAKEILERKGTTIKAAEKQKLLHDLMFLTQEIRSNIPFVHDCFNESVDKTVTEAKGEIDATYQTLRERLGDKVLSGEIEIPLLEEAKQEDNEDEHN